MTDKQNFEKNIYAPSKPHACDLCGAYDCNGDDCKLYQAYMCKEQECEELKSVRDSWISKCEQETKIKELYQDGLDPLKAQLLDQEAETLKGGGIIHQLEKAIEKIKELIQKEIDDCFDCGDCESCGYNCCLRQAMQICNEVISE